ncbi:MAG: hypothetical protein C4308_04480 [Chitinophagaceae bacterium]
MNQNRNNSNDDGNRSSKRRERNIGTHNDENKINSRLSAETDNEGMGNHEEIDRGKDRKNKQQGRNRSNRSMDA